MASHSADVTIGYSAKVVGRDDVDKLADSMADVEKAAPSGDLDVNAKVTGTRDVDKLADSLGDLPDDADIRVDLDVDPVTPISDLRKAVDRLENGDVTVDVDVTGETEVDTLKTDLAKLPAKTTLDVKVDADTQGLKDIESDVRDARDETAGFASEVTGTLGGQFSEGAGMVADFGEQFRNLKTAIGEADNKRKALGLAVGGIAGTLAAGFAIDAIMSLFENVNEQAEITKTNIEELAQAVIDSGGLIDKQFKLTQGKQVVKDPGFVALTEKGADYQLLLNGLTGDTKDYAATHATLQAAAEKSAKSIELSGGSFEQQQAAFQDVWTLEELAKKYGMVTDEAVASGRAFNKWAVGAGLAEDEVGKVANGVDILGDVMRHAGDDVDSATKDIREFNQTDLKDKNATITATDKASGKVSSYNQLRLNSKNGTLTATDTATGKVSSYNRLSLNTKTGMLTATDMATGKVVTFNAKALNDKTADLNLDTAPARADIASLNGTAVTGVLNLKPYVQDPRTGAYVPQRSSYSAAAGAPLSAPSAAAVPTVRMSAAAPVVTAPVVIQITGTVIDPAGAARALERVLTRGARRTRPVRIGANP